MLIRTASAVMMPRMLAVARRYEGARAISQRKLTGV